MVMSRIKGMLKKTSRVENFPPLEEDLTMDASPLAVADAAGRIFPVQPKPAFSGEACALTRYRPVKAQGLSR
jgi:hypothetical protein